MRIIPTHKAEITWTGGKDGSGEFSAESGAVEGMFTFPVRFEDELGSNPEELIGAAHPDYFSMQLTVFLKDEGYAPTSLHTAADVYLDPADGDDFEISCIDLTLDTDVPGIDEEMPDDLARRAKGNCSVSKVPTGPGLMLIATLA